MDKQEMKQVHAYRYCTYTMDTLAQERQYELTSNHKIPLSRRYDHARMLGEREWIGPW